MNSQRPLALLLLLALLSLFAMPANVFCQEDEAAAQALRDASIKRMQQRVEQIDAEIEKATLPRAHALGEEVYNLYGLIDKTYLQMKNAYEQQVIDLNLRMQRKWEQIESAGVEDRDTINDALEALENDWDRTFERLTQAHESHLAQLQQRLAKFGSEFSELAGQAQSELETSNFEAVSRWEKGHDLFLSLNRTYVQIVANQLQWQQDELAREPNSKKAQVRLAKTRVRHANIQTRFQKRLAAHIEHLDGELDTRLEHLNASSVWDTQREIMGIVDQLYARSHNTFDMLQTSCVELSEAYENELLALPTPDERAEKLNESIGEVKLALGESYLSRIEFINEQVLELESRIEKGATSEEEAVWKAKTTDLRLLAQSQRVKSAALAMPPAKTVFR